MEISLGANLPLCKMERCFCLRQILRLTFARVFLFVCFFLSLFSLCFFEFCPSPTMMVKLNFSYFLPLSSVILNLLPNRLFEAVVTHMHRRWGFVTHISRYAIQSFVLVTARNALKLCGGAEFTALQEDRKWSIEKLVTWKHWNPSSAWVLVSLIGK